MKRILSAFVVLALLSSCASKKRLAEIKSLQTNNQKVLADLSDCNKRISDLRAELQTKDGDLQGKLAQLQDLQSQLDYMKKTNTNLLDRLSDLSVVSKAGAESIKKSLETIQNISGSMQRKDSMNLVLVTNLKRSLADVNDQDVQIEVKKGVVYVSLSDKLLFRSGSYDINSRAENVLSKVAKVVNDHRDIDILVEGHTDVVPIETESIKDNWDLSVLRATSVVRMLQTKFGVSPERMVAGGRSEYIPKDDNTTASGRQLNRRTEIIITPKLDQFFNLLSSGK